MVGQKTSPPLLVLCPVESYSTTDAFKNLWYGFYITS